MLGAENAGKASSLTWTWELCRHEYGKPRRFGWLSYRTFFYPDLPERSKVNSRRIDPARDECERLSVITQFSNSCYSVPKASLRLPRLTRGLACDAGRNVSPPLESIKRLRGSA